MSDFFLLDNLIFKDLHVLSSFRYIIELSLYCVCVYLFVIAIFLYLSISDNGFLGGFSWLTIASSTLATSCFCVARTFAEHRNRYYCRAEAYIACDLHCVDEHVRDRHGRASRPRSKMQTCRICPFCIRMHAFRKFSFNDWRAPETDLDQSQLM